MDQMSVIWQCQRPEGKAYVLKQCVWCELTMCASVMRCRVCWQAAEVSTLRHDVEQQKELTSCAEVQAKFHQTQLNEEQRRHRVRVLSSSSSYRHWMLSNMWRCLVALVLLLLLLLLWSYNVGCELIVTGIHVELVMFVHSCHWLVCHCQWHLNLYFCQNYIKKLKC